MSRFWRGMVTGSMLGLAAGLYVFLNMDRRTERFLRLRTQRVGRIARNTMEDVKDKAAKSAARMGSVVRMGKSLVDGDLRGR